MTTQHAPHTPPLWRKFLSLPHTRLGWWAVGLEGLALVLVFGVPGVSLHDFIPYFLPFGVIFGCLAGVVGGVVGLIAVLRSYERSLLVWLTMVVAVPYIGLLLFAIGATLDSYGLA